MSEISVVRLMPLSNSYLPEIEPDMELKTIIKNEVEIAYEARNKKIEEIVRTVKEDEVLLVFNDEYKTEKKDFSNYAIWCFEYKIIKEADLKTYLRNFRDSWDGKVEVWRHPKVNLYKAHS